MNEIALFKLAHLLCFVYWLGADLGVFYSSTFVVNKELSRETRMATKNIMFTLDLAPRICMPLMLPTGVQLGYLMNLLKIPVTLVIATWVVCLLWLAMVLILHVNSGKRNIVFLTKSDFHFRWIAPIAFVAFAIYSLTSTQRIFPDYISYKLIIFAGTVLCGLMIRVKLRVFAPAFARLVEGVASDADNKAIYDSLVLTRPYVILIWVAILVNVGLSINLF